MKTIIFDMDGLMFDTETLWITSAVKIGKEMGYNFSKNLPISTIGTTQKTTEKLFKEKLGQDFPFELFHDKYRALMDEVIRKKGIKTKKGLKQLLNYLIKNNYTIAIGSSSTIDRINWYLEKANIDKNIFKLIFSGVNLKHSKPDPEIFITICQKLNINTSEAIVLEDSNNGIKAAHKAGCLSILIPDVDIIKEETRQMADYEFKDLTKVIDFLETQS